MEQDGHRRGPRLPLRLILHSCPRSASNIWMRLFERHPSISAAQYFIHRAFLWGPDRFIKEYKTPLAAGRVASSHDKTYQYEFQRLLDFIAAAESKKQIPFFKDHIYEVLAYKEFAAMVPDSKLTTIPSPKISTNDELTESFETDPTLRHPFVLPSSFVRTLAPVILIRHPARVVPSCYRICKFVYNFSVKDDEFKIFLGTHFPRLVYDFWAEYFNESEGKWPIVVDFDSLSKDPKGVMGRFCERVGIDEAGIAHEMEPVKKSEGFDASSQLDIFMQGKAYGSTGIFTDEANVGEPDLDEEEKKWAELYGEDVAEVMRNLVDDAMEDYKFLRSKSV